MNLHLEWLQSIGMHANPSKTECMIMNHSEEINFGDFKSTNTMKVLGLHFDHKLKWDVQTNHVVNSLLCMHLERSQNL